MKNLPKVVAQQRRGRETHPRLVDRKSDALPLSHRECGQRRDGELLSRVHSFVVAVLMSCRTGRCAGDCCAVATGQLPDCRVTTHDAVSDGRFIASLSAQPGTCGSESSPWLVEADSGQKLLFTLHDFAVQPAAAGQS